MRLSDQDILKKLESKDIIIKPKPLDDDIKGISIDLSLDNKFRVFSNHKIGAIDLSVSQKELNMAINTVMSDEILIQDGEKFVLHPGELALANTTEFIELADNLVGWLDGRSSLARLGLMVHVTAHKIDPGWRGQIVLEIFNSGKLPLTLKPGMKICAVNFETLSSPALKPYNLRHDSKYKNQAGAVASKFI